MEDVETTMKFLDSDFIINVLRRNPAVTAKFDEIFNEETGTTTVNEFEVLYGAIHAKRPHNIHETKLFFSFVNVLGFDRRAAQKAAEIHEHLAAEKGTQLDAKDLFIGAIVLSNNGTLITRNIKHFERIPEMKVEKW